MYQGYRKAFLIGCIVSVAIGLTCSGLVIFDENGYVASMTFVIVFYLLLAGCLILLLGGLIGLAAKDKTIGACMILISLLTPTSFLLFCVVAKVLGIGAYREQPIIPFHVTWSLKATNVKA